MDNPQNQELVNSCIFIQSNLASVTRNRKKKILKSFASAQYFIYVSQFLFSYLHTLDIKKIIFVFIQENVLPQIL